MFQGFLEFTGTISSGQPFICESRIYKMLTKDFVLIHCDYNTEFFTISLFQKLGIPLPTKIVGAVPKRLSEFLAGRYAAKLAMQHLASSNFAEVKIGLKREPIWPDGLIGSISHSQNRALCAVANTDETAAIGIDIENILDNDTFREVRKTIHNKKELFLLTSSGFNERLSTTLIFSAKESFFKAVFIKVKEYFGFEYARVIDVCTIRRRLILKTDESLVQKYNLKNEYSVIYDYNKKIVTTLLCEEGLY